MRHWFKKGFWTILQINTVAILILNDIYSIQHSSIFHPSNLTSNLSMNQSIHSSFFLLMMKKHIAKNCIIIQFKSIFKIKPSVRKITCRETETSSHFDLKFNLLPFSFSDGQSSMDASQDSHALSRHKELSKGSQIPKKIKQMSSN